MAVMEAIKTIYLEQDVASIEFLDIPWDYQHLRMQISARSTAGGDNYRIIYMRFGGDWGNDKVDTATNYGRIYFRFSGAYTYSTGSNAYLSPARILQEEENQSTYSPSIVDIYDYHNASKRSTIHFSSLASNQTSSGGSGELAMGGGVWNSSSGIKTIKITQQDNDFTRGSMFALYGWKNS